MFSATRHPAAWLRQTACVRLYTSHRSAHMQEERQHPIDPQPSISADNFILHTPRLTIIPLSAEHRDLFVAYRRRPGMDTYQRWEGATYDASIADDLIANGAARVPPEGGRIQLALLSSSRPETPSSTSDIQQLKEGSEGEPEGKATLVGDMSIKTVSAPTAYELGINVNPTFHGQGYGSEAVGAVTRWLLDRGVHRVQLRCHPENEGTHGIAHKLGFVDEGDEEPELFKGDMVRSRRYAKLR